MQRGLFNTVTITWYIWLYIRTRTQAPKPPTNSTAPILNNPVYDVGAGTQQVTNNNSVGPTYEQIDEAGNRYDVIGNRVDPVTNGEHTIRTMYYTTLGGQVIVTWLRQTPPPRITRFQHETIQRWIQTKTFNDNMYSVKAILQYRCMVIL